ncbi:hypothetical protein BH23ACT7_BH23ACT7_20590 [soil metagenome]
MPSNHPHRTRRALHPVARIHGLSGCLAPKSTRASGQSRTRSRSRVHGLEVRNSGSGRRNGFPVSRWTLGAHLAKRLTLSHVGKGRTRFGGPSSRMSP